MLAQDWNTNFLIIVQHDQHLCGDQSGGAGWTLFPGKCYLKVYLAWEKFSFLVQGRRLLRFVGFFVGGGILGGLFLRGDLLRGRGRRGGGRPPASHEDQVL